jgi:hypothetical protein
MPGWTATSSAATYAPCSAARLATPTDALAADTLGTGLLATPSGFEVQAAEMQQDSLRQRSPFQIGR